MQVPQAVRSVLSTTLLFLGVLCVGGKCGVGVTDSFAAPLEAELRAEADSRSALAEMMNKVSMVTLDNGVRIIMYRRGEAPVFSGAVVVRVGGSDELPGTTGVSHMFEHMAFKGTERIGTKDFARERELLKKIEEIALRTNGATEQFSAQDQQQWQALQEELQTVWEGEAFTRLLEKRGASGLNATTDKELTRYFVSLPRPSLELWAYLEAERILAPVMRQFYQERDVVLEERRMRFDDDPTGKLYEALLNTAFTKHSYRQPVIGYQEDISRLTATQTDEFRRKYYVAQNIVVAIVGDVDPERDRPVLERYFGQIPRGDSPPRPAITEPEQRQERTVVVEHPSAPEIMIAYHKPNYPHPDDPAISILSEILAGSRVSPLYTKLVQQEELSVTIDAEEGPGFAYPNLLIFHATLRHPHTAQEFTRRFDAVLEEFAERGPTDEELAIAKRSVAMAYLSRLGASMSLALDLASSEILYGNWRSGIEWYDLAMKVTKADVQRAARKYLRRERRTIARLDDSRRGEGGANA